MMQADKIGRMAWIGYLVASAPCAVFCAGMLVIALRMQFIEDIGPMESLPPTPVEKGISWFCLVAHPMLWTASLFLAHRFNEGWRVTVPFVLNLIPVAGLLWLAGVVGADRSQHYGWPVWYLRAIAVTLLVGLVAVIVSFRARTPSAAAGHAGQSPW